MSRRALTATALVHQQRLVPPAPEVDAALLPLGISKAVFDCKWPETKAVLDALWESKPHRLAAAPYRGGHERAEYDFLNAWLSWVAPVATLDLSQFRYAYATQGATEAIRESLVLHALAGARGAHRSVIHVLDGDYEGYAAEYEAYGGTVQRHARASAHQSIPASAQRGDRVYLSQPSAIDGMVWSGFESLLTTLAADAPECEVAVDLTYVGTVARAFTVPLSSPNISHIFFSLSKVMGVYFHRIGGAFTRTPLTGLYGNRWFKNIHSLALGTALLERFGVHALPRRYHGAQTAAVQTLRACSGVHFRPSDVVLLAHAPVPGDLRAPWATLARGAASDRWLRACLTPTLEAQWSAA